MTGTLSGQEATARGGVDPEALGVAFVNFFLRPECLVLGEVPAAEMRLEP